MGFALSPQPHSVLPLPLLLLRGPFLLLCPIKNKDFLGYCFFCLPGRSLIIKQHRLARWSLSSNNPLCSVLWPRCDPGRPAPLMGCTGRRIQWCSDSYREKFIASFRIYTLSSDSHTYGACNQRCALKTPFLLAVTLVYQGTNAAFN